MNDDGVVVSVICLAYNHEKYIRDALEGFVSQITDFKYEVLINDDASTDNTSLIIREYEHKYPKIIKPIYQNENQYSKGIKIVKDILIPRAKGKYLAFCEGDDYWCDCNKLQKQIDILENNSEYSACVHNTNYFYMNNGKCIKKYTDKNNVLYLKDCVMCGGQSFHTSSLVVRKKHYLNKPDFTTIVNGVGDYPNAIYYSLCGSIYYIGNVMSVYRVGTEGSWTKRVGTNRKKSEVVLSQIIHMLKVADSYSNYREHAIFLKAIEKQEYNLYFNNKKYRSVIRHPCFREESLMTKLRIYAYVAIPALPKLIDKIRKRKAANE